MRRGRPETSKGTIQGYGEIPAMDEEFEGQDAERKVCGQGPPAEHDFTGQSAAAPSCQGRLHNLLDALVDGIRLRHSGRYIGGGTEAGDRVDEMVGEGLHIPVATGRGPVQVVGTDRLDDVVHNDQCLFGTGEFVHRLSCQEMFNAAFI